jgi:ferritin-like metal-binding protein YciE
MAKKEAKTLDELFHDTLKDIYFAEKKRPSQTTGQRP